MGSMSRFSVIEKVISTFEDEIRSYFSNIIGLTVGEIKDDDIEVDLVVSAYVPLIGSSAVDGIEVHFGCTTEEEYYRGELVDGISALSFNQNVAGKKITSIAKSFSDRDDEVFLYAETENRQLLEIPLGFNPTTLEFYGYFEDILTENKRQWFVDNYTSIII